MPEGFLFIISAPSGTGKSTVCRELRKRDPRLGYSVSCSTRRPRPGESVGKHYFFLSPERFKRKAASGHFLEWARVHGHYYGTPRRAIDRQVRAGRVVLLDIDTQGAASIRRRRKDAVSVFLLPPSWRCLRSRLVGRKDTGDTLHMRMRNARREIRAAGRYDYLVVNDKLQQAVRQVEAIILAERLRVGRRRIGRGMKVV